MSRLMQMRFLGRLARNNFMKKLLIYTILPVVLVSLSFMLACQKEQLAEYKKFENDTEVPRITVEEAKKSYDTGNIVVVDSRPEAAFKNEHIAGAINIPFGSADDKFSTLPQGKKIIVYCD